MRNSARITSWKAACVAKAHGPAFWCKSSHVSSGIRLWSGDYEQRILSVLAAQKSIAERIVTDITPALHEALPLPVRSSPSEIGTVFTLYQKGRRYLDSRTEQGIRTSIEYFQKAIAADSRSALAYAGLADGYSLAARYEVFPPQESWIKARTAAMDAIRIDGTLAEAHAALAFIQLHHSRDWPSAEREFRAAIQTMHPLAAGVASGGSNGFLHSHEEGRSSKWRDQPHDQAESSVSAWARVRDFTSNVLAVRWWEALAIAIS